MRQLLNELLSEIGQRIGLDGLSLDENDLILLGLENDLYLTMHWREDTETLLLKAVLCQESCEDFERLRVLMQTNCILTLGHGMSFSLDPATDRIILSHVISVADRSSFILQEKLDAFINASVIWHQRLNSSEPLQPDWQRPATAGSEPSFDTLGIRV